jgi:diguanylate cyclase
LPTPPSPGPEVAASQHAATSAAPAPAATAGPVASGDAARRRSEPDPALVPTITRVSPLGAIRPALVFGIVEAVLIGLYFVPGRDLNLANVVYAATGFLAAGACIAGVRIHRPEARLPWYILAGGVALFATGDTLWWLLALFGELPFPSIADVSYVLGYPAIVAALFLVIAVRVRGGDRSGLLDGAILGTAVALVGWILLLEPLMRSGTDLLSLVISVAYPLGDLLAIGIAVGMLATPGPRAPSFLLLVVALLVQFLGDQVYAIQVAGDTFVDGGVLDATWMLAYAAFGLAALVPSMRDVAIPHPVPIAWLSPTRLVVMTLAMLTGPALMLAQGNGDLIVVFGGSVALTLLVIRRLVGIVRALARDNAARRTLEDELSFRATHDPLTGLANRRHFTEALAAVIESPGAAPLTVLFLDLDDFKGVNDTLGHAAGDALLVSVAGRIRGHLRAGDMAARMGGDEFGILLRLDEARAMSIGRRLLDSLLEPVAVAGARVVARGSVGVAQARLPGGSASGVLADADIAMYEAKAAGKGTVAAYVPGMRAQVVDRLQLEADLRRAIDTGAGLSLEYQPIVDLNSGRAVAVEALVRWRHEERGAIPPLEFVTLAERTNLARHLGEWVLGSACRQVATWRGTVEPALTLSVNLSARHAADPLVIAGVQGAARLAGLPLSALMLEVTEGALVAQGDASVAHLEALRAMGVTIAVDDFGTGYSSLGSLGTLPVDLLKIDRVFVGQLDGDGEGRRLAAIVAGIGSLLGLRTVAEGIERQEQLDALRELGCVLGQGYLLSPPIAPDAFTALYADEPRHAGGTSVLRFTLPRTPGAPSPVR